MRREERVTVQGPVKEQQPDGMSHRGAIFRFHAVIPQRGASIPMKRSGLELGPFWDNCL